MWFTSPVFSSTNACWLIESTVKADSLMPWLLLEPESYIPLVVDIDVIVLDDEEAEQMTEEMFDDFDKFMLSSGYPNMH